jgi:hypothetical protein
MTMPFQDYGRGRRKSLRRSFGYPARLRFGGELPSVACVIVDISHTGARLQVPEPADVPNEFALLIGGRPDVRRRCRVVWRSHDLIGVRFQGTAPATVRRVR